MIDDDGGSNQTIASTAQPTSKSSPSNLTNNIIISLTPEIPQRQSVQRILYYLSPLWMRRHVPRGLVLELPWFVWILSLSATKGNNGGTTLASSRWRGPTGDVRTVGSVRFCESCVAGLAILLERGKGGANLLSLSISRARPTDRSCCQKINCKNRV